MPSTYQVRIAITRFPGHVSTQRGCFLRHRLVLGPARAGRSSRGCVSILIGLRSETKKCENGRFALAVVALIADHDGESRQGGPNLCDFELVHGRNSFTLSREQKNDVRNGKLCRGRPLFH